jgi:flagellar biosynthesis protein FliQ
MSSFITFIKYKRLVVGKDFSPIVFLAAVLIIIITSITFNVDNSSFLFLPKNIALTLANLFNGLWILRNSYVEKDKEFSSYQRLFQVWIFLSLLAIYSFVSSPVIPVIGLLSISMFLSVFKISTILQVLEEIPKPPQKNKTSFNSNIDIKE